jgi:hypothetical protein
MRSGDRLCNPPQFAWLTVFRFVAIWNAELFAVVVKTHRILIQRHLSRLNLRDPHADGTALMAANCKGLFRLAATIGNKWNTNPGNYGFTDSGFAKQYDPSKADDIIFALGINQFLPVRSNQKDRPQNSTIGSRNRNEKWRPTERYLFVRIAADRDLHSLGIRDY